MPRDGARVLEAVLRAQGLEGGERREFLRDALGDAPELLRRAERSLECETRAEEWIRRPTPVLDWVGRALRERPIGDLGRAPSKGSMPTIPGYDIEGVLGEGGMGVVYSARQAAPVERRVAIKVIRAGMDSADLLQRFDSEKRSMARMSHPGIASAIDAGTSTDGRPYVVMEFVEGCSVVEYCDTHRLSLAGRLRLFVLICEAVHHAHERGVMHRDLKPSNILVTTLDGRPFPKIIDFGIAKSFEGQSPAGGPATVAGQVFGTPDYMSPEQAAGARGIDRRVDVFSLGVLLFELLVGRRPDTGRNRHLVHDRSAEFSARPEPRPSVRPSVRWAGLETPDAEALAALRDAPVASIQRVLRGDLDWVVLKAMERNRDRRYDSAAALADDIGRHLRREPVDAGPPSVWYRARRFVVRNRSLVLASLAVLASLTLGLAISVDQNLEARRRADEVMRLSDLKRLDTLERRAAALWPAHPRKAPAMREWISDARDLVARLPLHREKLAELEGAFRAAGEGSSGADAAETSWWYDTLAELVRRMEEFQVSDPHRGALASVEGRLDVAEALVFESIERHGREWNEAIESIANLRECPMYRGERITPQLGLVPIGRDPSSGLWEFSHWPSGELCSRRADGSLERTEASGLVFVLLPAGVAATGAQRHGDRRIDRHSEPKEAPVHEVPLEAFFLSKFEMTQAQWERFTGNNPSRYGPGRRIAGHVHDGRHPVENVSWTQCHDVLERLGLALPTEVQWEFAARAHSSTPWWTGDDRESLAGTTNLADAFCRTNGGPATWRYESWSDGFVAHAPVGSFRANAFGLHDILGNVREWCLDRYGSYELPVRRGDGLRSVPPRTKDDRVLRGGSCDVTAERARASTRGHGAPEVRSLNLGVRPARRLDRARTDATLDPVLAPEVDQRVESPQGMSDGEP